MSFVPETPQKDIDWALDVEKGVTHEQVFLYLECLNGDPMSARVKSKDLQKIRAGCILTGVFIRCSENSEKDA